MAKVDISAPVVLSVPDARAREIIATEASKGSDANLAVKDRRDRARISDRTDIAPQTIVRVGGEEMLLLGPGRGDGWMLLAWVEGGSNCYGTYHETQVQEGPR